MLSQIDAGWMEALKEEFEQPYYKKLQEFVEEEYHRTMVFPAREDVFNAFCYTPLSQVKVVILGQDPYHNVHQAHGLAFSVLPGETPPPSLVNIYKELAEDMHIPIPEHGYLKNWATQGVLLLNTVLTVRAHQANSHKGQGWERFTDAVIRVLDKQDQPMVFLLWGAPAQKKSSLLHNPKHLILTAPHPSPLSAYRGFFGCGHFHKTNDYLMTHGLSPIDWQL